MENEQLPIVKRLLDQIGDRDIVGYGSSVKKELIVDENYQIIGTFKDGVASYFCEEDEIKYNTKHE